MKRALRTLFLTVTLIAVILGATACGTVRPPSQQTIDATAVLLRGASAAGATVAITPPSGRPENAVYFRAASSAIGLFVTGTNYSPTALQDVLTQINSPELHNPWVQVAVGTALDLYNLYWGIYVRPNISSNAPIAIELLTAVQQGFTDAVGTGGPSPSLAFAHRGTVALLPRTLVVVKPVK